MTAGGRLEIAVVAAARGFDRVVVIDHGRLVDEGDYQTLARRDRSLAPLLAAE